MSIEKRRQASHKQPHEQRIKTCLPMLLVVCVLTHAAGCASGTPQRSNIASDRGSGANPGTDAWSNAIKTRDLEALEVMLDTNIDPDLPGAGGKTALMIAAQAGDLPLVTSLLEAGADANARNQHLGTPLMFAATGGSKPVSQILILNGAEVDAVARLGWTALLLAAAKGNTDVALLLIDAGANPDRADGYGWTPLMRAVTGRHLATAQALLATGLLNLDASEESGASALHIAAGEGQTGMVAALLDAGANPSATDAAGRTPATVAELAGFADLAAILSAASGTADRPGVSPAVDSAHRTD